MQPQPKEPDLLTVGAAARILGKSVSTVRNWCNNGTLAFERVENTRPAGNDRFCRRADVEALKVQLEAAKQDAANAAKE